MELLRFLRSLAPIRVFQSRANSIDELWIEDWESREIPSEGYRIWPQTFPWLPQYAQSGCSKCPPESVGLFYVANAKAAPVLEFSRSYPGQGRYGRLYWSRNFAAPHELDYDDDEFAEFADSVWKWLHEVGRRSPDAAKHSPYFLPDAWSRYGHIVSNTPAPTAAAAGS